MSATAPPPTLTLQDPARVLRRVARRTSLRPQRLVGAVLSVTRQYVVDAVDLPLDAGRQLGLRPHHQLAEVIGSVTPRSAGDAHALLMVHCRPGRVVWLPADLEWYELGLQVARTRGLRAADQILLTEHGWRTRPTRSAGTTPALTVP